MAVDFTEQRSFDTSGGYASDLASRADRSAGPFPEGEHYAALPDKKEDGRVTAHAVQTIRADATALYELWRDVTLFPRWQEYVISVAPSSANRSVWVVGDPDDENGKRVQFESELTEDIPGRKLAWQSVSSEVEQFGSVTFEPSPAGRGTLVTLIQTVKMPGGVLGDSAVTTAKRGPKQVVIENLRHFKQLAETGEIPSVKGQPHGPRGISGGIKEWMYGENNPTPPGTDERE